MVVEDLSSEKEGFLTVKKGQLVEVYDQTGANWLMVTLATGPGDLDDEGFLTALCLHPTSKS